MNHRLSLNNKPFGNNNFCGTDENELFFSCFKYGGCGAKKSTTPHVGGDFVKKMTSKMTFREIREIFLCPANVEGNKGFVVLRDRRLLPVG